LGKRSVGVDVRRPCRRVLRDLRPFAHANAQNRVGDNATEDVACRRHLPQHLSTLAEHASGRRADHAAAAGIRQLLPAADLLALRTSP
jgi:hypothetical protein